MSVTGDARVYASLIRRARSAHVRSARSRRGSAHEHVKTWFRGSAALIARVMKKRPTCWLVLGSTLPLGVAAAGQQPSGSIRGVVYDKDFGIPIAAAQVTAVETGQKVMTSEQGNFVLSEVPPGKYTLVFSKDGYIRQVKAGVVVNAGQLADVDVWLMGEFTDLDEFVVQDVFQFAAGSESALLNLRLDSPALMDSIGSELMSRAGASDAAAALKLVAGASVQDGKYAVIRGLPDRYVSSQMNGVRLPTADENKRAVELDQFPAAVIESIQVTKTFMPDQQGDASGGAVDVRLKSIPDQAILQIKGELSYNSQVTGEDDFLTYDGGGVSYLGNDGGNDIQFDKLGDDWDGAVGTKRGDAPTDYKWSISAGGKHELDNGVRIGGFANVYYERDSSFYDDGQDNSLWVENPGDPMTPQQLQGSANPGGGGDFKTALFDITKGTQSVQWGALGTVGLESEHNKLALTYLYTHDAEDSATLAVDTRGKAFYFPGYDPDDPLDPGNSANNLHTAPYIRTETLQYTERSTQTLQLAGRHTLPFDDKDFGERLKLHAPQIDWVLSTSKATLDQPDKREFGALWLAPSFNPGFPPFIPPSTTNPVWLPLNPSDNINLGNLQRIWKDIEEQSNQVSLNLKFPFEQWSGREGFFKVGAFNDDVERKFNQDTFSNFGDASSSFPADFATPWSSVFPDQDGHPITESKFDVDYDGDLEVGAWYGMLDVPLDSRFKLVGGARFESTSISIVNHPEENALWYPPGNSAAESLDPGDADVDFNQRDVLPAIGLEFAPAKEVTFRGSFSETVARQTFKELTPILQQEFLGGPVFIGNPELGMSSLKNYDLRVDCTPYEGSLVSASWFDKEIEDPIEYVQRVTAFTFTTPVNYPKGDLSGFELEARQQLGHFWHSMEGLSVGFNGTFIESEVTLPDDEAAVLAGTELEAPMKTRDMTNAPDHILNLYATYDIQRTGTQFGVFYNVQGDTLVAGAGEKDGNFVPSVYAKEYDTLNFSIAQKLGRYVRLQFQAKNLTNPRIEEVYRSEFIDDDVTKTVYTKGIEYSLSLSAELSF